MSESQLKTPEKRVSLADMARAAAQRSSSRPPPPVAPNVPGSGSSLSSLASSASSANPTSSRGSAPTFDDDSGVVNLHMLTVGSSVDPSTVNVAPKQAPAPPLQAQVASTASRATDDLDFPKPKRRVGPLALGLLIAAAGIGAAYAIVSSRGRQAAQQEAAPVEAAPAPVEAKTEAPAAQADKAAPATKPAQGPAPAVQKGAKPAAAAPVVLAARETHPADKVPEAAKPAAAAKGNDSQDPLAGAIAKAAGPSGAPKEDDAPKAAVQNVGTDVPDAPGKGAIASAISGPRGVARTCLEGASSPARVSLTFGSDGKVQSVDVSGAGGASDCIKKAFLRANVGAFRRPSFSFPTTVSPP
jgi:hypothetical protein